MKTNDQNLEATVTCWHADAEPPTALRARVLENATVIQSLIPGTPHINRRRVWWATGVAMAASAAAIAIIATVTSPARPAFADVQKAMAQIKTVQWDSDSSSYETATKKARHFTNYQAARLNPPATYTKYPGGNVTVETPEWEYQWSPQSLRKDKNTGKPLPWATRSKRFLWDKDPVADLRRQIDVQILPPQLTTAANPNLTAVTTVVEDGRTLLRFDGQLGRKRHFPERLTRPGSRCTVWVDPVTRRVVRTRSEYYDGTKHDIWIHKNFRYNEPLPVSLFDGEALMSSLRK